MKNSGLCVYCRNTISKELSWNYGHSLETKETDRKYFLNASFKCDE